MAKAGSIYYVTSDPNDPDGKKQTTFVGSSWDMKMNADDPRKVLSFSIKKGDNWVKLSHLTYEDGTRIDVSDKTLLYKPAAGGKKGGRSEDIPF